MAKWYVVVTAVNAEAKACAELTGQGIQHFLPVMRISRFDRRKHVTVTITKALFARYLFVKVDDFGALHCCDSILSILGVQGRPVSVPDADVERWQGAVAAGMFDRIALKGKDIRKGDAVRFEGGAFHGFAGQVISAQGKKMVRVMADLFGGATMIQVPCDSLVKVA